MSRRQAYTRVERINFNLPEHVKGKGDVGYRVFECLNPQCRNMIQIQTEDLPPDFEFECEECGFQHKAGEVINIYEYNLINNTENRVIENGEFSILHDDYIAEALEYKYCIICGLLKPLQSFDIHSRRKTGRQGECRLCKHVYNSIKNQTRLTEQHREASQKRRLYVQFDSKNKIDVNEIYRRFDNKCFKCGLDLSADLVANSEKKMGNLDHTLPVYYLWPLTTDNATLLCKVHNGEKAEKWPGEFYSRQELASLSRLTGVEARVLAGAPIFNPEAIDILKNPKFVEGLDDKFSRYPNEVYNLRNRIKRVTGFDFFDNPNLKISANWVIEADKLI